MMILVSSPSLILTPRQTEDAQVLWRAAIELGWDVHRLSAWRVPPELTNLEEPVLYAEALFGPQLAKQLGIELVGPDDNWLPRIPWRYRKRDVRLTTMSEAQQGSGKRFIKPPNDKSFTAGVYSGLELPREFDGAMPVLVSDVVFWESEFRCFILERRLRASSLYARNGGLQMTASAEEFAELHRFVDTMLDDPELQLPDAVVLDVGVIRNSGWAVVEANAAWGAGTYGCDPAEVLHVIRRASRKIVPGTPPDPNG